MTASQKRGFSARPAPWLLPALVVWVLAGCLPAFGPAARPFNSPVVHRLIAGVPFYPDDTSHCGPSSLAAVLTFHGRPTTVEEVAADVQRADLRGSLGPDLMLWARNHGFAARLAALTPEELVELIDAQKPVILLLDSGLGPVRRGHFIVAVGYAPDGLVANTGLVRQQIIPWSSLLTDWHRMGRFAVAIDGLAPPADGRPAGLDAEAAPRPGFEGGPGVFVAPTPTGLEGADLSDFEGLSRPAAAPLLHQAAPVRAATDENQRGPADGSALPFETTDLGGVAAPADGSALPFETTDLGGAAAPADVAGEPGARP
ncbi:MAG: C39 family peptidase [Deltaproteobacteria bacterium]|jgi:hypothetical protein|nr:C39 family peptidase [Deltaproteobacteria bacterium]